MRLENGIPRERCKGVHCVDLGESFPNSNEYLLANFGFDTADNEPSKVCRIPRRSSAGCTGPLHHAVRRRPRTSHQHQDAARRGGGSGPGDRRDGRHGGVAIRSPDDAVLSAGEEPQKSREKDKTYTQIKNSSNLRNKHRG